MPPPDRRAEIDDILVDCYDEEEMFAAWEVAFQDRVATPFRAAIFGTPVEVQDFRAEDHAIQCLVTRDGEQRWVGIESLDATDLPADFLHVLDLYRSWQTGQC